MEKLNVSVKSFIVITDTDIPYVALTLAKPIKGFACERDNNGKVIVNFDGTNNRKETEVDVIYIPRAQLTAELCEANESIALFKFCKGTAFEQKDFGMFLFNSVLTIVRSFHKEGDNIQNRDGENVLDKEGNALLYSNDCYTTNVVGITLGDNAEKYINKKLYED